MAPAWRRRCPPAFLFHPEERGRCGKRRRKRDPRGGEGRVTGGIAENPWKMCGSVRRRRGGWGNLPSRRATRNAPRSIRAFFGRDCPRGGKGAEERVRITFGSPFLAWGRPKEDAKGARDARFVDSLPNLWGSVWESTNRMEDYPKIRAALSGVRQIREGFGLKTGPDP